MKILLVRPPSSPETIGLQHVMICEPLELEYLAAMVPEHQVTIIDLILEKKPFIDLLATYQPELIGFTGYITHVNIIKNLASQAKKWSANSCITVVGGVHAEVVPEDFADMNLDYVVCANGLETFQEIVRTESQGEHLTTDTGLYRKGKPKPLKKKSFIAPHPARDKVARYRKQYYYLFHNPCALLKTSFGCPFDCSFCFCREITNHAYFCRPLDDVMVELETLSEQEVYIVDDNFLVYRERVLAFCDELERRKIKKRFLIYGRADFIAQNKDVIERFATLGLRAVIVGLESCRSEDLKQYQKGNLPSINEEAVTTLADCGVDCYATLILGIDWGIDEFKELKEWLLDLNLVFINLQPFTPLPGTLMGTLHDEQLRVPRTTYEKWDLAHLVLHPTRLSVASYYWQIIKLYYSVTLRPRAVWSLVRRFGLYENLQLSVGSSRVTWQYLKKVVRNLVKTA